MIAKVNQKSSFSKEYLKLSDLGIFASFEKRGREGEDVSGKSSWRQSLSYSVILLDTWVF